jgi:gamma-glutamyltranspeptidase/glutathione hydrolase
MASTIICKNGKPIVALGLPGGTRIPTITAQLAISLIDFGATPEEAVHATRVHSEAPGPLLVSDSIPPAIAGELQAMGHSLKFGQHALGTPMMLGGPANIVRINRNGELEAASTAATDASAVVTL